MRTVTIHQAATQWLQFLAVVEAGEEIVITRGHTPVARLMPFQPVPAQTRPRVGTATSPPVRCTNDALAPMTDEELDDWGL